MLYRLVENHPSIGIKGQIIDTEQKKSIPHYDWPLLEPLSDDYSLAFSFEIKNGRVISKFLFETIFDISEFLNHLTYFDGWVVSGAFKAANEKRGFKYLGDQKSLILTIND